VAGTKPGWDFALQQFSLSFGATVSMVRVMRVRPSRSTLLGSLLTVGLLLGWGILSALVGRSAAQDVLDPGSGGPGRVARQLRVACFGSTAALDVSVVEAQLDGVHIALANADTSRLLRFRNHAGHVISVERDTRGAALVDLSPGRWYAACPSDATRPFANGVPLDVRDDGHFYLSTEVGCHFVQVGAIQAVTHRAWTQPELEIRRVAAVGANDIVEPAGYVALAAHRDAYPSFNYRIVRNDVVIARAEISRDGLLIFGCIGMRN
jgi:hypothetical protein